MVDSPVALDAFDALVLTAEEAPPADDPVPVEVVVPLECEQAAGARSNGTRRTVVALEAMRSLYAPLRALAT